MARPRKNGVNHSPPLPPALASWAEAIGDAIGRGVVRALNTGITGTPLGNGHAELAPRRRGRPAKVVTGGPVPTERRCTVSGCGREARSKGLCSAHYQAERRRLLAADARPS
ncbi:hypothetical protein P2318_22595 [Myxococcaceae bacterium GXIMD 01537]